ncbi:class I SAM-dependent methyltransferase [Alphaproteobacteria bacterium LSUCC0719]
MGDDGNTDDPTGNGEGETLLAGAYALQTPDQHVSYYRDFAAQYDSAFADGLGYVYPLAIAAALSDLTRPPGRILDIGCGTGLVASAIHDRQPEAVLDGVDISPEMIEKAGEKDAYDSLFVADLTQDFSHLPTGYAAIVSAGTFTHGHLGPEPLAGLVDHCLSGAVAALGVNSVHFAAHGFQQSLDGLLARGRITVPQLREVPIYDGRDAAHADDTAFVLTFYVA